MYICLCIVGKIFNKCDVVNYICVLDYCVVMFEVMGEIDCVRFDVEWFLELVFWLLEVCCWFSLVVVFGMFVEVL